MVKMIDSEDVWIQYTTKLSFFSLEPRPSLLPRQFSDRCVAGCRTSVPHGKSHEAYTLFLSQSSLHACACTYAPCLPEPRCSRMIEFASPVLVLSRLELY